VACREACLPRGLCCVTRAGIHSVCAFFLGNLGETQPGGCHSIVAGLNSTDVADSDASNSSAVICDDEEGNEGSENGVSLRALL